MNPVTPINIAATIRILQVGETATFPIEKTQSVRVTATNLGMTQERVYKTTTNREDRTITVTRIS